MMKLLKNDFVRPFAIGFGAAAALVVAVMHHGPVERMTQSLLPAAQAADSASR
jgi:hypothetical protein